MGKNQGRNRSSGLPPYPLSSKDSYKTKYIPQHTRETNCGSLVEERDLSHSRSSQLSSNPFQFVKTRGEDSTTSPALRRPVGPATAANTVNTTSEEQYRYYQTNQNRWLNQNEYKVHNINCWLDNVLKNNQSNLEQGEDFELIQESSGTDSNDLEVDSLSCSFRAEQRYQPYGACTTRELLNVDENETSYRQDMITTLKALIPRHDERSNGGKRFQHRMDTNEQSSCYEASYHQDKSRTLKALIARHGEECFNAAGANRFQNLGAKKENKNNVNKRSCPDRGKNCSTQQNAKPKTGCKAVKADKKTSFDIRNPNSIFFAVMMEEHIKTEQISPRIAHSVARRRKVKVCTQHSAWSCCGSETLGERKEDFSLSHMELDHVSA